jgi:hypothetical protein
MAIPQADFAKLPTFAQDAYKKIIGQASNIADRPIDAAALAPDLDPFQQQAAAVLTQGLGSYVPYLEQAAQYAGPQGADAFMNPYTQNVVDQTTQQLQKQFGLQQAQADQRAIQSGSFAGSGTRGAIFDAALQGEQFDVLGKTVADLYNQGFTQAQQAAQTGAGIIGGLGQQLQGQRLADVNALFNLGGARRDVDAQRAMFGYQLPISQSSFLQQAFMGMPMFQAPPMPNPLQSGISLGGIFGGFGG